MGAVVLGLVRRKEAEKRSLNDDDDQEG